MKKEQTAFKHPKCGGVIVQYEQDDAIIFECELCGERAVDIDRLIMHSLVIMRRGTNQPSKSE